MRGTANLRIATFYSESRLDGLVRREEHLGVKLAETFVAREDKLLYR